MTVMEYDNKKMQMGHEYLKLINNIEGLIKIELANINWETINERIEEGYLIEMLILLAKLYSKAKLINEISNF